MKIGLQLYSIKELMEKDFYGTLKKVADIGYQGVEFAGYYGNDALSIKKALSEYGLEVIGTHTMLDNPENIVAFEKALGNRRLVQPCAQINNTDDLDRTIKTLQNAVDYLKPLGFQAGYHNHAHEFVKYDDKYALDIIFESVPELICEIDVFWVAHENINPVDYIKKYSGRVPLLHIKDITAEKKSTEIGSGLINMESVIKTASECKTEWLIVEQEIFEKYPMLESIKISYEYIKNNACLIG